MPYMLKHLQTMNVNSKILCMHIDRQSLCNAVILFCCVPTLPATIQDWAVLKQNLLCHEYNGGHFIAHKNANFEKETD